jgi:ATP-dependent Clp protease ATP-binding subunit ClpC
MTSNLGTEFVKKSGALGFLQGTEDDEARASNEKIEKALKSTFRPEFLNRIDEIITFSPLSLDQMREIVDLQMKEVQEQLSEHNLQVQLSPEARNWLAEIGYDPSFGARPLRRAIQKHLESPLSVSLLSGEFSEGDTILAEVNESEDALSFSKLEAAVPVEDVSQIEV